MPDTPEPLTSAIPAPLAVSATARLQYVFRHFKLAYENVPRVSIGYADSEPGVVVADGAADFFSLNQAYPAAPSWRQWQGQSVPFFFDCQPERALLAGGPSGVTINVDIISAAFYLLSGWQEYFSPARDRHGRFPYAASVQQQFGFVTVPVVNYYFAVLAAAIELKTGQALRPRRWLGTPFSAFITHDIDSLNGGWGTAARHLVQKRDLTGTAKLLADKVLRKPAPWNNLEQVQKATAAFGAPSTYFILGSNRPAANGTANADYPVDTPTFQARLQTLAAKGAEIASHASYGTSEDLSKLQAELQQFGAFQPLGNRFHYLCWEPTTTPAIVAQAGFAYDSTLGFAEHFGFRNSYCLPFLPFDFATGQAHTFWEIPLNVMDATLDHPNYLQLQAYEILPALQPMLAEIEKFGGVATVLWHNDHFDPANTTTGPAQFNEIMKHLQWRGAVFLTGRQIISKLCPKPD